jgi:CheY-like chemotaxis protein
MRFPLYHRPNALVFLDDDNNYVDMLGTVMPRDWSVRLFSHIEDCLQLFALEHALWETDVWKHQRLADSARNGELVIRKILEYWQSDNHRYGLTQTCVVDFAMPAMTGLDFLKKIPVFPSNRVLLTGRADELIAVGAFNDGLIDRFIPKQHNDIGRHLISVLTEQHQKPMEFYEGIWRNALKKAQYSVLQESSVQLDLHKLVRERHWVEYVVLSAPFGILALNQHACAHWLQLELRSDLAAAADLAQSTGQTTAVIESVREGKRFVNTELLMAMGSDHESRVAPTFCIGSSNGLIGALFPLEQNTTYGTSHREFLASLPPRSAAEESRY